MYRHAAISAAQPNSSLKAPSVAIPSCHGRNEGCSVPCFWRLFAVERRAAVWAILRRRDREDDSSASGSLPPRIPSSTRGHASGPFRRPSARRRSAFSVPPKTSLRSRGKVRRSNFFRAPPIKHSLAHIMKGRPHPLWCERSKKPQGGSARWTASSMSAWTFTRKQSRLQCVTRRGRS